jgi:Ser/Thr protein kinase RdoA (MazF antagonist)
VRAAAPAGTRPSSLRARCPTSAAVGGAVDDDRRPLYRAAMVIVSPPPPPHVLARWRDLADREARPLVGGLINQTFVVEGASGRVVVQKLHKVFAGTVNADIDAITAHLAGKGLTTPRIVRADDGALWVEDGADVWRALSFVPGRSVDKVDAPARAGEAGALVGRFHLALADLRHDFAFSRGNVHDTKKHLATLETAVSTHKLHRLYAEVVPVAERLLARARALPDLSTLPMPMRTCHGDLKISNVLFDERGAAVCLVDLDTLAPMLWAHEMGDALRSWCNPAGEDVADATFDLDVFAAAVQGYAKTARAFVTVDEARALVAGVQTICLELSARFLADALNEAYFGWDPRRFPGRGEHNLLRARGQLSLALDVEKKGADAERVVARALG